MAKQRQKAAPGTYSAPFRPKWSDAPKRTLIKYLELFHTSPRLDAVDMIATDIGNAEFFIFGKSDYEKNKLSAAPITNSRIIDVLQNPMPYSKGFDGFVLFYLTTVYRKLLGEALWVIEKDGRGIPVEAYIVPPHWIQSVPTKDVPYFEILPGRNLDACSIKVHIDDTVYFRDPDILNPYGRGRARTEAIGDELETDEFASKYSKRYFYNDATPPIVIIPESHTPTQEQADGLKKNWLQRFGGWINARLPAILTFKASIQKLADAPREMDFVESRKFLRDQVNQHFAIPPELFGNVENSNRATINSSYYLYTKNTLSKDIKRFQATLNQQFIPMFKEDVCLIFDTVVPADEEFALTQSNDGLKNGTMTVNEWRQINGLQEIKGQDIFLRPFNVVAVGLNETEPPEPEDETEPDDDSDIIDIEENSLDFSDVDFKQITLEANLRAKQAEFKKSYWNMFDKAAESGEQGFVEAIKKSSKEQEKAVSEKFSKYAREGFSLQDSAELAIREVFNLSVDEALAENLAPAWLSSMQDGFNLAKEVLGSPESIDFQLYNDNFSRWIQEFGLEKASTINTTTKEALLEAIKDGKSIEQMMDILQKEHKNLETWRAKLIARTETLTTVNFGAQVTYEGEGVQRKEWLTGRPGDPTTRPGHEDADGQQVPIKANFKIKNSSGGVDELKFPGDPSAPAAQICNCRCTFLPVIATGLEEVETT